MYIYVYFYTYQFSIYTNKYTNDRHIIYIYIYLDLDIKIDQYNGQIVEPIDIHVLPNFHHPKGVKPQTVKQTWTSLNSNNFVGCKCINVQAISLGSWTTQR